MSEPLHEAVAIPSALAGALRRRGEVPVPSGYAVFDCETTGTDPDVDEIVALALVLLDRDGVETGRFSSLVRPLCPIPEDATAIHGISDADVADAPTFARLAGRLVGLLEGRVFAAHNASFDLAMLQHAFQAAGLESVRTPCDRVRLPPNKRHEMVSGVRSGHAWLFFHRLGSTA
jgi:DNA polymerase III subunit epsilon